MSADRRPPRRSPGEAQIPEQDHDFTLTASLFFDAVTFADLARSAENEDRPLYEIARYARVSIYCSFVYLEAALNEAAWAHVHSHREHLDQITQDVLEECQTVLEGGGLIVRKSRFYPFEERFLFLVRFLCGREFPKSGELWERLRGVRALRDYWTHPKPPFRLDDGLTSTAAVSTYEVIRDVVLEIHALMKREPPLWLAQTGHKSGGD